MSQDWTPERIEELTRLWNEGLPTGEIGRQLGFTKNAVIGKAHRLGLPKRQSPIQQVPAPAKPAAETEPRKAAAKVIPAPVTPRRAAPEPAPQAVTLERLKGGMCCWPIGEPGTAGFHFCGEQVVPGKPYCLRHCEIAYVKSSKSDKDLSKETAAA